MGEERGRQLFQEGHCKFHRQTQNQRKRTLGMDMENSNVIVFYIHFVESTNNYTTIMEKMLRNLIQKSGP